MKLQDGDGAIDPVEGTTGAGGLDDIVRGADRPPVQSGIRSVSAGCRFTRIIGFSIRSAGPAPAVVPADGTPQAHGDDVTASTAYVRPQEVDEDRTCGTDLGAGTPGPWPEGLTCRAPAGPQRSGAAQYGGTPHQP